MFRLLSNIGLDPGASQVFCLSLAAILDRVAMLIAEFARGWPSEGFAAELNEMAILTDYFPALPLPQNASGVREWTIGESVFVRHHANLSTPMISHGGMIPKGFAVECFSYHRSTSWVTKRNHCRNTPPAIGRDS